MLGHTLEFYTISTDTPLALLYIQQGISAGFPSPALDYLDATIDLNRELIKKPSSTFYARVKGVSMKDAGIDDGDLMIIDRSVPPTDGRIAVCFIDGEFTVKRIKMESDCLWLMPENIDYKPIKVTEENQFLIWGTVIYLIKEM